MGKFKLINPLVTGTFTDVFESESADKAAKLCWDALTADGKYISGNVPKFLFTLQSVSDKELHHYMVKELPSDTVADYSIDKINVSLTKEQKKEFLDDVKKARKNSEKMMRTTVQDGGKHRKRYEEDDSSSSDDSDTDLDDMFKYIRIRNSVRPIMHWWYSPSIYNVDTIYTPTFVSPLSPYVQLWVPSTRWIPMR